MALQTKVYTSTNNGFTLELTLVENSTSTSANTSSISYTLKLKSTTKDFAQYGVGATVVLDGKTVATRDRYSASQISIGTYASVTLLSGTTTVGHGTNGQKSMSVKFTLDMATSSWTPGPMTGTATMTLTNIPRQATITSAPNFYDEDNPVLKYSNPAGGTLRAGIATTSGTFKVAYRTVTGSSYTFNLTSSERDALRGISTTSNTVSVRFYLKTTIGGQTFTTYSTKTLTIKNPAPTLAPAVEDVNPTTLALTGNANTLIKGHSTASVTTGAQAVKKATLKSQKVTCGKKTLTGNGAIEAVESGIFAIEVTDSRGNTTKQTVMKTLIDYFPPTCAIQLGTPDLLGRFTLKASGIAFVGSFGSVKNAVTVQYRYRVQGSSSWPSWQSMSVSGDQTYTATASLTGLDPHATYEFQVRATDKLSTTESGIKVVVARALVKFARNHVKFNVPVKLAEIDDSGGESTYNLLGAAKAVTNSYDMDVTMTKGANYSRVTGSAVLVGNQLRCYFNTTRTSATPVGNIDNEEVCTFRINHGGKIHLLYHAAFTTGASGGIGTFQVIDISYYDDYLTFNVYLAATTTAMTSFNAYFVCPVTLNLDAFE